MKPVVIAIPETGTTLFEKYLKSKYTKSLLDADAVKNGKEIRPSDDSSDVIIRWIDLTDPEAAVKEALDADGLLLAGGADINPALYGRQREQKCGKPDSIRDLAEPLILKTFFNTGRPILGVCRGMQMINVCFGGTLTQDIRKMQQEKHFDILRKSSGSHHVKLDSRSQLAAILGSDIAFVNSLHHQAVDRVGSGLRAIAKSEDGFVEALEIADYDFGFAVQWHPEHMQQDKAQQNLIAAFVQSCRYRNAE